MPIADNNGVDQKRSNIIASINNKRMQSASRKQVVNTQRRCNPTNTDK